MTVANAPIDPQHKRFVEEWIVDYNPVRAYRAAGFEADSDATARAEAATLLVREDVATYIVQVQLRRSPVSAGEKLEPQHKRFAEEWVIDHNSVRAYRAAGFVVDNDTIARIEAFGLLEQEDIGNYIEELHAAQLEDQSKIEELGQKLKGEHRTFAEEWVIDHDSDRAYRAAGYEPKDSNAAHMGASRLLARPDVSAYVNALHSQLTRKRQLTGAMVIEEQRRMAFSNIKYLITAEDKSFSLKDLASLPDEYTAAISKLTQKSTKTGAVVLESVELHDKQAALKSLAKYFGVDLNPHELLSRIRGLGFTLDDKFAKPQTGEEVQESLSEEQV